MPPAAKCSRANKMTHTRHVARVAIAYAVLACAYVISICIIAFVPRDRSSEQPNCSTELYFDSARHLEWDAGRARVIEKWYRIHLLAVIPNPDELQRSYVPIRFHFPTIDNLPSNQSMPLAGAIPRVLPGRLAKTAHVDEADGRHWNCRIFDWGWPLPILSCSVWSDDFKYVVEGGLPGPGLVSVWESDGSFQRGPDRPNGGLIPLRVHWLNLALVSIPLTLGWLLLSAGVGAACRACGVDIPSSRRFARALLALDVPGDPRMVRRARRCLLAAYAIGIGTSLLLLYTTFATFWVGYQDSRSLIIRDGAICLDWMKTTEGVFDWSMDIRRKDAEWCWWFGTYAWSDGYFREYWAPLWTLFAPAAWLIVRARRHLRAGARTSRACVRCGYDLGGLPSEAQCPECGSPQTVESCCRRVVSAIRRMGETVCGSRGRKS